MQHPPTLTYSEQEWRELPTLALIEEGMRWAEQASWHLYTIRHAFNDFCQNTEPMNTLGGNLYRQNYDDLTRAIRGQEIATEQMLWYVVERDRRLSQMPLAQLLHTWENGGTVNVIHGTSDQYKESVEKRLRPIFQEAAWPSESIDTLEGMAHDIDAWLAFAAVNRDSGNPCHISPRISNGPIQALRPRLRRHIDERLEQRQQQSLAIAGGLHPRLGAASGLRVFDDELLRHIGGHL